MSTQVPGFQSFFRIFLHLVVLVNLVTWSIRVSYWLVTWAILVSNGGRVGINEFSAALVSWLTVF